MTTPSDQADRKLAGVVTVVLAVSAVVFAAVLAYVALIADTGRWGAGFGAVVVAAAAAAVGTLIGFLFGVPESVRELRSPAPTSPPPTDAATPGAAPPAAPAISSDRVTQLVQIADWLTKLLVGVTLTQLGDIPEHLRTLGEYASDSIVGHDGGAAALAGTIIYFATFGFFTGYLSTRLVLNAALRRVDHEPLTLRTDDREAVLAAQDASKTSSSPTLEIPEAARKRLSSIDGSRLSAPEDLLAWGLARATGDRGDRKALSALKRARDLEPHDRRTVEGLVYASLYAEPPEGFRTAIQEAERFLDQRGTPTREDSTLLAYLACAYGQAYAWELDDGRRGSVLATYRREVVEAVRRTLAVDPTWKPRLASFSTASAIDDDLARVAADEPELRTLLGLSTTGKG